MDEMSLFKKIKEKVRDKTRDELTAHLRALGVDAEMVERGAPDDIGGKGLLETDLGSIRIQGREINVIWLKRWTSGNESSMDIYYDIHYAVHIAAEGRQEELKVSTSWKTKGLLRPQILDVEWSGGKIANLLNEDKSLREALLQEKRQKKLKNITITPDDEKPYIRICVGSLDKRDLMISKNAFDCYNTIARHIRNFLTTGTSPARTSAKYCIECGTLLPVDADYCASCGAKQTSVHARPRQVKGFEAKFGMPPRSLLEQKIRVEGGSVEGVARELGIGKATLYKYAEKFNLL